MGLSFLICKANFISSFGVLPNRYIKEKSHRHRLDWFLPECYSIRRTQTRHAVQCPQGGTRTISSTNASTSLCSKHLGQTGSDHFTGDIPSEPNGRLDGGASLSLCD